LWAKGSDYDTGKPLYCRVAWGEPHRGYSAEFAGKQLLLATWRKEISQGWHLDVEQFLKPNVDEEGLLKEADIEEIRELLIQELEGG
jgi:hypothetical protein